MLAAAVLICSVASLIGSVVVLTMTVRINRALDRTERALRRILGKEGDRG